MRAVVLTISDKGSRGDRIDESGPLLKAWLAERRITTVASEIIPDEQHQIAARIALLCDEHDPELLITSGGTGVSPRDVTPEATRAVITREIPGLSELMRLRSMLKTPMASLSRAVCGVRGASLVLNLPGSPKGDTENLEAVWDTLHHAIAKIRGDQSDCAGIRATPAR